MSRTQKDKIRALIKIDRWTNDKWSSWKYNWGFYGQIPSWWKRLRRRMRRAKEKDALRTGKQIPRFKKSDDWDWF